MKKIYDKLLLLLAVLALIGGVFFYFAKSQAAMQQQSALIVQSGDKPYQAVPVPNPAAKDAAWPEPGPQSSGPNWVYDVFTPPKIYLDADGNFTPVPPKPPEPPEPFGIYLAEMQRKLFRIQMQGYSGSREKPEEAAIFFFDEERQLRVTLRPGQTNEAAGMEVIDFKIDRRIYNSSNVEVIATATILDKRTGQEVKLRDTERLYEPGVTLVFRSEQDSSVEVELLVEPTKPQTAFETPAGKFVLQEINLEASTVTVEKQATEERESEIKTLTISNLNPTPAPLTPDALPASSDEDSAANFIF